MFHNGMKSIAYYLTLIALLSIFWSCKNVFTDWTRRENFETFNAKSLLNYINAKALKVKDMKWKYENMNNREGSLISRDVAQTFDIKVPNCDDEFDVKS